MLNLGLHMGTYSADEYEAQKNVRCHPGPASVPAVQQGQKDSEPDPVERDESGPCVTHKEEERRSRQSSENTPPVGIINEKIAEVVNRNQNNCDCFQPVGIVNDRKCTLRTRGVVHVRAHGRSPGGAVSSDISRSIPGAGFLKSIRPGS